LLQVLLNGIGYASVINSVDRTVISGSWTVAVLLCLWT